ncbi:MAG: SHOCT domain-containing protein [Armatimonadetes bacterium]|nr:SHOCT domain-containing protein [Armatimonadota bacterium]
MARKQISEERKAVYYLGMVLMVIGFLTFISVFFSFFSTIFGGINSGSIVMESHGLGDLGPIGSIFLRAPIGMVMMIIGGVLMGVGSKGLAGSGVILDPEKAREDFEPWTRMAGGMVKDAVDEAGIDLAHTLGHQDSSDMPFDEKLRRLHQLRIDGIINDEEYEVEKKKILEQG